MRPKDKNAGDHGGDNRRGRLIKPELVAAPAPHGFQEEGRDPLDANVTREDAVRRRRRLRDPVRAGAGGAGRRRRRARHRHPRVRRTPSSTSRCPVGHAAATGLGAAGARGLPRGAAHRRTRPLSLPPASTRRGVIGIATDFTACTMVPTLADGTPLCELEEYADRPHAYVKLWRHHAAQAQADRINDLGRSPRRGVAPALRRADLLGVGVRQGTAGLRGGPRALPPDGAVGRGRRLDRLAAVRHLRPQRLHRRLQGDPPGRASTRARSSSTQLAPGLRRLRRRQAGAPDRPARRPGRDPDGRRPLPGPACPRASRSRSATSTRTSPRLRRRPSSPARWWRSWAPRPAT